MYRISPKVKIYMNQFELENFQCVCVCVVCGGRGGFEHLQRFRSPTIIIFAAFGPEVKIYQIVLKSTIISADAFAVLL